MRSLFKFYRDSRQRQFKADKAENEAILLAWLVAQYCKHAIIVIHIVYFWNELFEHELHICIHTYV